MNENNRLLSCSGNFCYDQRLLLGHHLQSLHDLRTIREREARPVLKLRHLLNPSRMDFIVYLVWITMKYFFLLLHCK